MTDQKERENNRPVYKNYTIKLRIYLQKEVRETTEVCLPQKKMCKKSCLNEEELIGNHKRDK